MMNLKELQDKQITQMSNKNCLPQNSNEVILHLVEEIGELCEAVREKQSKENFENEIADIIKRFVAEKLEPTKVWIVDLGYGAYYDYDMDSLVFDTREKALKFIYKELKDTFRDSNRFDRKCVMRYFLENERMPMEVIDSVQCYLFEKTFK